MRRGRRKWDPRAAAVAGVDNNDDDNLVSSNLAKVSFARQAQSNESLVLSVFLLVFRTPASVARTCNCFDGREMYISEFFEIN